MTDDIDTRETMIRDMTAELMINHSNLHLGRAREIAEEITDDIIERADKGFHIPTVRDVPRYIK